MMDTVADAPSEAADLLLLADVGEAVKRGDIAARCRRESARIVSPSAATVVFAGQFNKGKSSLINALLGFPDLLPVDVDVTTGAWVRVGYAANPSAEVGTGQSAESVPIMVDDLHAWISEQGNPGNCKGVQYAAVFMPSDLLAAGLTVVDTPGINGLSPAHTQMTLSMLPEADALVYVVDAFSPVSEPDLEFLTHAVGLVPLVLVVLSKIDAIPDWTDVYDEDRQIIRDRLPELDPSNLMPISPRLAAQGLRSGLTDPQRAAERIARSGLDRLRDALIDDVAGRRQTLRLRAANLIGRRASAELSRVCRDKAEAMADSQARAAQLSDVESQIRSFRTAATGWETKLHGVFASVFKTFSNAGQDAVAELQRQYDHEIETIWRRGQLASFSDSVAAELVRRTASARLGVQDRLMGAVGETAATLGVAALDIGLDETRVTTRDPSAPLPPGRVNQAMKLRLARQLIFTSTGGNSPTLAGGAMSVAGGVIGVVGWPVAVGILAINVGFIAMEYRAASKASEQREAHRFCAEAVSTWQRDLTSALYDGIWDLHRVAIAELNAAVKSRINALEAQQAALTNEHDHNADEAAVIRLTRLAAAVDEVGRRCQSRLDVLGGVALAGSAATA